MNPFQWHVWTAVLASIPVIAAVMCLVHKVSGDDKKQIFGNFLHNVLYAFAAFLNEGELFVVTIPIFLVSK